jgi:serine/threonine-protein phosphatase CPPED1
MSDEEATTANDRSSLNRDDAFRSVQRNRTVVHPRLDQSRHHPTPAAADRGSEDAEADDDDDDGHVVHTFVVCADTQLGMTNMNRNWEVEMEHSRRAVELVNGLDPRPLFCCVCGDLVDMTSLIYRGMPLIGEGSSSSTTTTTTTLSEEDCDRIQDAQFRDFKQVWSQIHPDIALVCLCGNHDVGNRPTPASIERFVSNFGDDYLSWWTNGSFNIVVNTSLFADPTAAQALFDEQLRWLEGRLQHAHQNGASHIFVFGHHPWFLYREDETHDELPGESPFPPEWGLRPDLGRTSERDGYFHVPIERRRQALALFERYGVSAAFSGHFHQNLIAKASFGMDMIVTGPLSLVFQSNGVPEDFSEPKTRGLRVVRVRRSAGRFEHEFVSL